MEAPPNSSNPLDALPPSSQAEADAARRIFEFDHFRLDPANRLLTAEGKEVALPGRAFDLLLRLVGHPGELLTKEDLLTAVWEGSFVEESNLTVAISTLRRALGEDPQDRRYIQTVARRGYRFIAPVREVDAAARLPRFVETAAPTVVVSPQASEEFSYAPASAAVAEMPKTRSWPLGLLYAVLLGALAFGAWKLLKPHAPLHTLAVLPLTVSSPTGAKAPSEIELLGMTDALVSHLEGQLVVRPTSSVLKYSAAETVDPVAAGVEQGVDAVLIGSLAMGNDAALRLRLVRVRDGLTLWQNTFHAADLAGLQQVAGTAVTEELRRLGATNADKAVAPAESPLAKASNPAYPLYLRGRYFWNQRTVDGLHKSIESFRQAIAADPNFAPAYAGLADSYALLASFSVEPGSSANADARSAALSAIQLDPALAEPHASLGMIYFFTDWRLAAAESEFERAIELNPNYATAHHWYALDLAAEGRFPQALYEVRLAQKLDPLSLIIGTNVGWIEYLGRDYAAATADLHRVLELDPKFARARTRLGMVEMSQGDYAGAIRNLTQALAASGEKDPYVAGLLGDALAQSGDKAAAQRILDDLHRRSATEYVPPISRGLVLLGLHRNAEAIKELEQAVDDHSTSMVYAKVDPTLDPLRGETTFPSLLTDIKP